MTASSFQPATTAPDSGRTVTMVGGATSGGPPAGRPDSHRRRPARPERIRAAQRSELAGQHVALLAPRLSFFPFRATTSAGARETKLVG